MVVGEYLLRTNVVSETSKKRPIAAPQRFLAAVDSARSSDAKVRSG